VKNEGGAPQILDNGNSVFHRGYSMKQGLQGTSSGGSSGEQLQAVQEMEESEDDDVRLVRGEVVVVVDVDGGGAKGGGGIGAGEAAAAAAEAAKAKNNPFDAKQLSFDAMKKRDAIITGDV
jgi:hypothetical protein